MHKMISNKRSLGLNFNVAGQAEILLWIPKAESVAVRTKDHADLILSPKKHGYWESTTDEIEPGTVYQVVIDGEAIPDIYSLCQPDGVHGPSQALRLDEIIWTDSNWKNPALEDYLSYELHTGTFTPSGTFKGIEQKLDHLVDLGITAIELMPLAQFSGDRNWGYDGVFPFAVQGSYGGAAGLQQLVNSCHAKGLAVVLDVVFNHIGPEGNYLSQYGPYFTDKYRTPWGNAINFDDAGSDEVRRFFIENAIMWFRDFHIDALRLDAVHAIKDFGPKHFLKELREAVDELSRQTKRTYYLIAECDLNDHRFIDPVSKSGYGLDAQWTDEFHHALRVCAGEKSKGYYSDFFGIASLVAAYEHAYVYHGQYSDQRQKSFGTDPAANPGKQFVVFSQNHDQIGNRMLGERSGELFGAEMQKLLAAAVMIGPFLPLIFMGEEYAEPNPFLYFVSHSDPKLISAVRDGRRAEFAAFHEGGETPDPQAEATFLRSKLQWDKLGQERHQTMLRYYQALIKLRKTHPVLRVPNRANLQVNGNQDSGTLTVSRTNGALTLHCLLNFSKQEQYLKLPDHHKNSVIIFNSAAKNWNITPNVINFVADGGLVKIPPESILIFEQHV